MNVVSVNLGQARSFRGPRLTSNREYSSSRSPGAVAITPLGLEGDVIVDSANHGGVPTRQFTVYGTPTTTGGRRRWGARCNRDFRRELTISRACQR